MNIGCLTKWKWQEITSPKNSWINYSSVLIETPIMNSPYHTTQSSLRWRHNDHAGVSNHQPCDCLLNRLFRRRSKEASKLRVTGLCVGNSPGTGEFPAQMASSAENISIWWRHHDDNWCLPGLSGSRQSPFFENSHWGRARIYCTINYTFLREKFISTGKTHVQHSIRIT